MNTKFVWIVSGIFVSFFFYATLQERLFKGTFGDNEKFTFVMTLLGINSIVTLLYGYLVKTIYPYSVEKPIPTVFCISMSLFQVLAMASSFMALQWVSYPAQVLAKSSKPIPVMIMGVILGEKQYPLRKYGIVFLIVIGVSLFFYNGDKASASSSSGFGIGEVLLLMSLFVDGLMNSMQERIMAKYKPNSNYLMLETNKWVALLTILFSVFSGEYLKFIDFVQNFPATIGLILLMSLCSAFGQFFIFAGITELGTLTISLATTTRKFFTVLFSVILFGHQISLRQWFAIFCVFSGLLLDTFLGKSAKKSVTK